MTAGMRQLLKRGFFNAVLILLCFCIQTSVFPLLPMFSSVPNLLLILTFSFGFIYGSRTGMLCGLFAGLLMDLFYTGTFGFYSMIFVILGFLNGLFTQYYYDDFITLPLVLCGLSDFLYNFYIYVLRYLLRARLDFGYYFWKIILPEMVFSVIVTLFVYRLLLMANKHFDRIQDKRGQNVA